jgi:hypothetical protein
MGAKDLKDEKIKPCVQLIDDEVLNIVDSSPLFLTHGIVSAAQMFDKLYCMLIQYGPNEVEWQYGTPPFHIQLVPCVYSLFFMEIFFLC